MYLLLFIMCLNFKLILFIYKSIFIECYINGNIIKIIFKYAVLISIHFLLLGIVVFLYPKLLLVTLCSTLEE